MIDDLERLGAKWTRESGGDTWLRGRWGTSVRRARRDPRAVAELLRSELVRPARVLDVACGTGRLRPAIEALGHAWVGCDASADQLRAGAGARVRVSASRLPFASASFDAVVACRFLHHLASDAVLESVVAELVRVSRGPVVASFWDRDTWPFVGRARPSDGARAGTLQRDTSGRVARSLARIEAVFAAAGAPVVRVTRPVWRLSAQTFVLARGNGAERS